MMLNDYDRQFMESTVQDIVESWNTKIILLDPLPENEQIHFNVKMREGKLIYKKKIIPAERKYIVNNYDEDVKIKEQGQKDEGAVLFAVPKIIDGDDFRIDTDMLFTVDNSGDIYRVRGLRDRIGEWLLMLYKLTGTIDIEIQE